MYYSHEEGNMYYSRVTKREICITVQIHEEGNMYYSRVTKREICITVESRRGKYILQLSHEEGNMYYS